MTARYPDPPTNPQLLASWAADLVRSLNQAGSASDAAGGFTPTTTATVREFDAATASLADIANALGTLIKDLQQR